MRSSSARMLVATLMWVVSALLPGSVASRFVWPIAPPTSVDPAPLVAEASERVGSAQITIRDEAGNPLAHVLVRALVIKERVAYLAGRGVTKSDGTLEMPGLTVAPHWFLAEAPGRARASLSRFVALERVVLELRLGPERPLVVEVRDDRGAPIESAEVEAKGPDPMPKGGASGKDGNATMHGLSSGPVRLIVRKAGYDEANLPVNGTDAVVRVTLKKLGALLVTVDGSKDPKNVTVFVAGGRLSVPRSTPVLADGHVRIAGLAAGSYDLRAVSGSLVSQVEIGVIVQRGEDTPIRLRLVEGRFVKIRVLDDTGTVIAGSEVALVEGGLSPFPLEGKTDSRGELTLGPVAPGLASLGAIASDFVPRGPLDSADPKLLKDGVLQIVLRRAGTLLGDVRDEKGRPIDGATLEVVGSDLDGQPISVTPASIGFRAALSARGNSTGRTLIPMGELGVVPGPVPPIPRIGSRANETEERKTPWVTLTDGTFRVSPVPPGRLRVVARHPAYVEGISGVVEVAPGGEGTVHLVLAAGGRLVGRVKDHRGNGVGGAIVEVAAKRGTTSQVVRAASDGSYAFAAVPTEVLVTVATSDRPNETALRVEASVPDGGTKELDLELPEARGAVVLRVRDDRLRTVQGAQVTVSSLDPAAPVKSTGFTDERGEVEIPRVEGLRVQIEVRARGFALYRVSEPAVKRRHEVELSSGLIVTGIVLSPGGRVAQKDATVTLLSDGVVRRAITDKEGRFSFADVAKGPATIEARASGSASVRKDTEVAPFGSRAEHDVGRIELGAAGILEGTVTDERGRGVAGARVARDHAPTFLAGGADRAVAGIAITDATGAFRLVDVAVGDVELEAYHADFGRGRSGVLRVDSGRTLTRVAISLKSSPGTGKGTGVELATGGVAITLGTLGESEAKVVVVVVAEGSEAERAGIRVGDELTHVDSVAVVSVEAARAKLAGPLGSDTVVTIHRGTTDRTLRVVRESIRR